MRVTRLELTNFRCYRTLDLALPSGSALFVGHNAQGKSSLLEAVFTAATTRSPFAVTERELVRWTAGDDDGQAYGRVSATIQREDGEHRVEVTWILAPADGGPERPAAKRVRVDGTARRAVDALGELQAVLFAPRDLALVDGPPAQRRRYLDVLLCQLDRAYCRSLATAARVVTQRNHLLRQLRTRGASDELAYWDEQLAAHAALVWVRRWAAVAELERRAAELHTDLAGGGALALRYVDSLAERLDGLDQPLPQRDDPDAVAEAYLGLLARPQLRREEVARGASVVGPHRDDLVFTVDGVDMRTYGSRGQQRTVALAVKLAEAAVMTSRTGEAPVILLDDVLSELDPPRRATLVARLPASGQALVTATDLAQVPAELAAAADVFTVAGATVASGAAGQRSTSPVEA